MCCSAVQSQRYVRAHREAPSLQLDLDSEEDTRASPQLLRYKRALDSDRGAAPPVGAAAAAANAAAAVQNGAAPAVLDIRAEVL